jgi:hypothetical protein
MEIYKISIKNKELASTAPSLYFQEQITAEAVIKTFDFLTAKDKKIEWECEVIQVLSHEEAFNHLSELGKELLA